MGGAHGDDAQPSGGSGGVGGVSPRSSHPQVRVFWQLARRLAAWIAALAALIFSSDPTRFLPTRGHKHARTHHHHHHHHCTTSTSTSTSSSSSTANGRLAAPIGTSTSAPPSPSPAPHLTPPNSPSPAASSLVAASSSASSSARDGSATAGVFLSRLSFPLPSSSLPAARFTYVADEVPWPLRLLASGVAAAIGARTTQPADEAASNRASGSGSSNNSSHGSSSSGSAAQGSSTRQSTPIPSPLSSDRHRKRWTLILDLDETLVHTMTTPPADYDGRVEIHTRRAKRVFFVLKRPYLDTFLATLSQAYDIVIFTASIRRYADAVINLIDVHHSVSRRYFRPHCVKHGSSFLKDLRSLPASSSAHSIDLRRTILIDNSPVAYALQEENGLPIATWTSDPHDTALRDLIPFLLALRAVDDVRPLLYRRHVLQRTVEANLADAPQLPTPQIPHTSSIIEEDEEAEDDLEPPAEHCRRTTRTTPRPTAD